MQLSYITFPSFKTRVVVNCSIWTTCPDWKSQIVEKVCSEQKFESAEEVCTERDIFSICNVFYFFLECNQLSCSVIEAKETIPHCDFEVSTESTAATNSRKSLTSQIVMQMLKKPLVKKTTRTKLSKVQQRKMNYASEVHLEDPRSHSMEVYGNMW